MVHHRLIDILIGISIFIAVSMTISIGLIEWYYGYGYYAIGILLGFYFLIPFVFRCSPFLQRQLILMHLAKTNYGCDGKKYFDPVKHNIFGANNFYLSPQSGIQIGVWHILPNSCLKNEENSAQDSYDFELLLRESGHPILLYFHGNMGTRASGHRIDLYRVLRSLDFHVIAFDYRGFADSSISIPCDLNESGLVADAHCVYKWIRQIIKEEQTNVYFWGHSLGTGVAVHLAAELSSYETPLPKGIILEAPFTNMSDAALTSFSSLIFRPLPLSIRKWLLTSKLKENDLAFESDHHILQITIPVLILHAKLDMVVPYRLGKKLFEIAKANPKNQDLETRRVFMTTFRGETRSGAHIMIWKEPDLIKCLQDFILVTKDN